MPQLLLIRRKRRNLSSSLMAAFLVAVLLLATSTVSFSHVVQGWARSPSLFRLDGAPRSLVMMSSLSSSKSARSGERGKLLVLGGTGFLGQTVCRRALLEGYEVTSLSRRGLPFPTASSSDTSSTSLASGNIDYRVGDARKKESVTNILDEGGYVGVIHCIGLLLDEASGLGEFNRFASGSGSLPDAGSTYDTIIRLTAFNAIEGTTDYVKANGLVGSDFPFVFVSAAETGWPDVPGGQAIEQYLAPDWLRRYLQAKRAVEAKLSEVGKESLLRPVIPRPSLIYSLDRPASYLPVGAFFVGNTIGLPFVDRPVTVQSLANAIVRSIAQQSVRSVLRYAQIDELSQ